MYFLHSKKRRRDRMSCVSVATTNDRLTAFMAARASRSGWGSQIRDVGFYVREPDATFDFRPDEAAVRHQHVMTVTAEERGWVDFL